jgi:hypothetical protein
VPARRVAGALEGLLELYIAAGGAWDRVSPEALKSALGSSIDDETATDEDFIDLGETAPFEVQSGEGECAV